jgi:hypothetical protein
MLAKFFFTSLTLKSPKKGVGSGFISQRYISRDPDPDPHQYGTDPQHWWYGSGVRRILQIVRVPYIFDTFDIARSDMFLMKSKLSQVNFTGTKSTFSDQTRSIKLLKCRQRCFYSEHSFRRGRLCGSP